MKNLTQEKWAEGVSKDENVQILDVRTEEEFGEGNIPNAINIDIYKGQEFLDEVDKIDKSANVYVYCRSGARSAQACALMEQRGFHNTYNLQGGIIEWKGDINK